MAGETQLHFFYLDHQSNYWERLNAGERERTQKKVEVWSKNDFLLFSDFQLTVGSNHHLSVFGPRFCVADDEGLIRVSVSLTT